MEVKRTERGWKGILAVNRLIKEFMLMSDYEISRIAHKNYVEVLFGEDVE